MGTMFSVIDPALGHSKNSLIGQVHGQETNKIANFRQIEKLCAVH